MIEMRVDRQHPGRGDPDGVSVRRGLGHGSDTDIATRARPVLDHKRLMQVFRDQRLQGADDDVGASARRKGHDDLDRLVGISLRCVGQKQRQA